MMFPEIQQTLMDQAHKRYVTYLNEIEDKKNKIAKIKRGELSIAEMQSKDSERWFKRLEREEFNALERINGTSDFQDISVLDDIKTLSKSVCRIVVRNRYSTKGYGTGFLIAPNLLLTNNHVLEKPESAIHSLAQFNYEMGKGGRPLKESTFELDPHSFFMTSPYKKTRNDPHSGLDFTVVGIKPISSEGNSLNNFPFAFLDPNIGKIADGEHCSVIQHPEGNYKKIVLKDIRMITTKDDFLIYESDTLQGSSGSMVIGLATGEVIGLHHSAIPRRDNENRVLRKDGTLWKNGDPDNSIDWIGNEGIRISSIMKTIDQMTVIPKMQNLKATIFGRSKDSDFTAPILIDDPIELDNSRLLMSQEKHRIRQQFEILLSPNSTLIDDWFENSSLLVANFIRYERLFPYSTDKDLKRYGYLEIESPDNPWDIAARIEELPQVDLCTPDIPMLTDSVDDETSWNAGEEQYECFLGSAKTDWRKNESDFRSKWFFAEHTKEAIDKNDTVKFKTWHWDAIKYKNDIITDIEQLKKIKIVQLDTGYDEHHKVKGNYDLKWDEDFVDKDNDAKDEFVGGLLRQPGHGGRTASILMGKHPDKNKIINDGSHGILIDKFNIPLCPLIPYRVAQSVVLIGRGRSLFDAANQAINSGADIIMTCMGSYPRPMLYKVAQHAYQNGVIWICAAGNMVESTVAPAMYPGTIAVAATNPDDIIWKHSSYGAAVDIAAPGEDIFVPSLDHRGKDVMSFGSGTSYATPQVVAAAALWKAKHYEELNSLDEKWKVVELFREALKASARTPDGWDIEKYGEGILDIQKIMGAKCKPSALKSNAIENAYQYMPRNPFPDLGAREGFTWLWNTLRRKLTSGHQEFIETHPLSERAKRSLAALTTNKKFDPLERESVFSDNDAHDLIQAYFESFQKNS